MSFCQYRRTQVITPAKSMALVTLSQAKDALGISAEDSSQDGKVGQQIAQVSQAVNNFCDRVFVIQTYRDQMRHAYGKFGEPFVTRQYPIIIDDALIVTQDGASLDPLLFEAYPETGSLYRLDSAAAPIGWAAALLVVDYTAGFDPIPADVQGAALEWLTARWHAIGRDPALRSETIPDIIAQVYAGDAGAGTSAGAIPPGARELLEAYRIWSV
jgi:hypothetical protein